MPTELPPAPPAITAPAIPGGSLAPLDDLTVDYESGPLAVLQNDQRYGPNGTPYNAATVALTRNLFVAERTAIEARLWQRHTFILLYAPLDITTRVTLGSPLTFRDTTFPAGSVVDHRYLFDGVRASYMFRPWAEGRWTLETGATLGIRNAQVAITQTNGERHAAEYDIGPVPALKLRARYDAGRGVYALWDFDGLMTPGLSTVKGGILDTALTLGIPLGDRLDGTMRLRYLSGGAEVSSRDLVNWAQFFGASLGIRWSPI